MARSACNNGTSFSSPAVAGALALLLQAFPNLTGRQAVEILLTTAREAGTPGTDGVYGRGLLDLVQAFQPVGSTRVGTLSGQNVSVTTERFSYTGGAFGDGIGLQDLQFRVDAEEDRAGSVEDLRGGFRLLRGILPEGL